jgi:hypothetical protein
MLRIGIPLLIVVSIALFVPKKVRDTLGILGILGILAAWAIGVLAVVRWRPASQKHPQWPKARKLPRVIAVRRATSGHEFRLAPDF